jgi:hypothetical protein
VASRSRIAFFVISPIFIFVFVTSARFTPSYFGPSPLWEDWSWTWYLFAWDGAAWWYLAGAGVSLGLLALAEMSGAFVLKIALGVVWVPLLAVSALAGVVWTIGGLGCLLGWLLNFGGPGQTTYTWAATTNFIVLAVSGLGAPALAGVVYGCSEDGFGSARRTQG